MWLSEKLHERSSMFDNMESAVSGTLRFAEAMGAIVTQRAVLATSIRCSFSSSTSASHMASTAVRYLTLQRVDGSTQRTSVVVTDPLLCPPELDLYSSVPPFVFVCWGVLAPRRLASPQSLSCAIQHVDSLDSTTTEPVAACYSRTQTCPQRL